MPKARRVNVKRRRRVAKESRKNLKLWAEGAWESILRPHIEGYADALVRGWKAERDYFQAVCTEYHSRIDWRLEDFQEPSTPLPAYNPEATPMNEDLTPEEQLAKVERIKIVNARIRRWLKYRVRAVKKQFTQTTNPRKNPFGVLMAKLSGIHTPPKARQAYQQFMHESYYERIDPVIQERWREKVKEEGMPPHSLPTTAFQSKVSRDLFNALPSDEQVYYSKKAKAEALQAKQEYEEQVSKEISLDPEAIQSPYIPSFLGPIIQGIQERTNLKFTIFYGGPCPRFNGEVNGYYINYGRNRAANPVPFTSYRTEHFNGVVWPLYKEWLRSCYCEQESKAAALSSVSHPPPSNFKQESSSSEDEDSASAESDSDTSDEVTDNEQHPSKRQRTANASARSKRFVQPNSKSKSSPSASAPGLKPQDIASKKRPKSKATNRRRATAPSAPRPASTPAPAVQPARSQRNAGSGHPLASLNDANNANENNANKNHANKNHVNNHSPSSLPPTFPDPGSSAVLPLKIGPAVPSTDQRSLQNATSAPSNIPLPPGPITPNLQLNASSVLSNSPVTASTPTVAIEVSSPTVSAPVNNPQASPTRTPTEQYSTATAPSTAYANTGAIDSQPSLSTTTSAQLTTTTAPPTEDTSLSTTTSAQPALTVTTTLAQPALTTASSPGTANPTIPPSSSTTTSTQLALTVTTTLAQPALTTASSPGTANPTIAPSSSTTTSAQPALTNASSPGTANPTITPVPDIPASAAQWFRDAFQSVTAQPLCPEFTEVICCFTAIELAHSFCNPLKGLSARLRPDELKRWIAGGRWRVRAPVVKDPARFAERWWAWWCILQPQWRKTTSGPLVRPVITQIYGDNWETLSFPGQNGILSVVATLYWWGCTVVDQPGSEQHADWLSAVHDVTWILQGLLKHLGAKV